ncbi:VOC family protein [Streptomyces sp. CA-111067]|uniref:VOC family protein n=1 Tax=Streptomyces sp. CA-111067 TaxID=3240046 RepID=UPI003D96E355
MKWSHTALNCTDLARTEEFYTRWFGFRRVRAIDLGDTQIVFLKLGDAYLELFSGTAVGAADGRQAKADGPDLPGHTRHLAFQTDDVDAVLREMGPAAEVTHGPLDFDGFIPGWRSVWLADPDGVTVEVSQGYQDDPELVGAASATAGGA